MIKIHRNAILLLLLLTCCVEPYPIKSTSYEELLVVEGFISTEIIQHKVVISKTSSIDKPEFIPETGAQVSIKDNHGSLITLQENTPGVYLTPTTSGIIGNVYTLYITTKSGQQLVSDEVTLRDTPDIQDIYAAYSPDLNVGGSKGGIQIFLDTEDPNREAHFYRWEYEETWEIQTPFESEFAWLGGNNVVFRDVPVSICYASDTSNNILIQSTQGLNADKITAQVIQTIPEDSPQLIHKYSILVKQYAISENAYLYWKTLRDVNQSQGTLYDTQPGTVRGNITSLTDNQVVLGYFDAGVVKQMRVFFTPTNFKASGYLPPDYGSNCTFITAIQIPASQIGDFLSNNPGLEIQGATGAGDATLYLLPTACCDCTSLGTNIKPSFWQ